MHPTTAQLRLAQTPLRNAWETLGAVGRGTMRRFIDARGLDLAASLAYSALLTLVPLIASVTVLTSTLFGRSGTGIYRILRLAVPGAGRELVADLQTLVRYASLSGTATLFFLVDVGPDVLPRRGSREGAVGHDRHPAAAPPARSARLCPSRSSDPSRSAS